MVADGGRGALEAEAHEVGGILDPLHGNDYARGRVVAFSLLGSGLGLTPSSQHHFLCLVQAQQLWPLHLLSFWPLFSSCSLQLPLRGSRHRHQVRQQLELLRLGSWHFSLLWLPKSGSGNSSGETACADICGTAFILSSESNWRNLAASARWSVRTSWL